MSWREIWSVERLGSKVAAHVSPDGNKVSIGVTNMLSRIGVSNGVTLDEAHELALSILEVTGGRT